ncbi:MAG: nuclear transport factor 2 family protein [Gemmatimonadota bacterium]|nr:MAG: nuclear transport factor 2 family protein [Gemmatimonadota bacterium]
MRRTMIVVLLLGWSGTLAAQGPATAERDAEEVKATLVAMWAAIEDGHIERYASYIHPEITVFGENDVYLAEGKELEVRGVADWVERAPGVHTELHQPQVTVRGDVAWITYYWTDSGVQDGERFSTRGKSTRIFVREGGRWLCIHAHFTAVP